MRNLASLPEESFDRLPSRETRKYQDYRWEYDGAYPYKRLAKWLNAQVGRNVDQIISDFVHLPWMPARERVYSLFARQVEMNTFVHKGKVAYFAGSYWWKGLADPDLPKGALYADNDSSPSLFRDPRNNKLVLLGKQPKRREKPAPNYWILGHYDQLHYEFGVWYQYRVNNVTKTIQEKCDPNASLKNGLSYTIDIPNVAKGVWPKVWTFYVPIEKRQLSGKELKRYGIVNQPWTAQQKREYEAERRRSWNLGLTKPGR